MRIHTVGKNSKVSRKELRYAAEFMAELLMPRMCDNLYVKIHSVDNLKSEEGELVKAYIAIIGGSKASSPRPRRFGIYLNSKLSKREQLLALAHEITHCKQFARREMIHGGPNIVVWKKEKVDERKISYFLLPWEMESYGYERGLYYTYLDHIDENEIQF